MGAAGTNIDHAATQLLVSGHLYLQGWVTESVLQMGPGRCVHSCPGKQKR